MKPLYSMACSMLRVMVKTSCLSVFLVTTFGGFYSISTFAAETATIEEIVVTARKREENLQDVPAAVSAFSADALRNAGADNIVDLENLTPNITINETSGLLPGSVQIFIRGIGNDPGFDQGVGIYVDDVYLNRTSGSLLEVYDVQRIEVLKGPQGNLYGRNTIGGAVKYVSRAPSEETEATIELKTGTDSLVKMKGGISGALSDNLLGGLSFSSTNRDGYQTNRFDGGEYASADKLAFRGTLIWEASDNISVKLTADSFKDDSDPTVPNRVAIEQTGGGGLGTFAFLLGGANMVIPGSAFLTEPLDTSLPSNVDDVNTAHTTNGYNRFEIDSKGISLAVNWDINDNWSLKSVTSRRDLDNTLPFDFDGTHQVFINTIQDRESEDFSQEFQLNYGSDNVNAVFGLYHLDADQSILGFTEQTPLLRLLTAHDRVGIQDDRETQSFSVYGNVDWDINEQWQLSVGGRYTKDEKDIEQVSEVTITHYAAAFLGFPGLERAPLVLTPGMEDVFAANLPVLFFLPHFGNDGSFLGVGNQVDVENFTAARDGSDEWSEFTPSAKLSYRPNDDMLIYAGYASGFKSGGFDTSGSESRVLSYKPELVDTYSLGLKSTLANGRVRLNVEVFHNDYTEKQLQSIALLPTGLESITSNVGEVTSSGVEIEFLWLPPVDGLTVNLNLGYLDSDIDEFIELQDDGAGGINSVNVASNFELGYAPETTAQFGVQYEFSINGGNMMIGANAAYRSEMYTDSPIDLTSTFMANTESESRTMVNAMLAYTSSTGNWRVALEGKNLSDKRSLVNTFNVTNFITGGYTRGRTWGLSVRYNM